MTYIRVLVNFGLILGLVALSTAPAAASEPGCFHTAAEAAVRSGAHDSAGFRLESVERDAFAEVRWARVRSCANPERPALLVPLAPGVEVTAAMRRGYGQGASFAAAQPAILLAGHRVTLVIQDESTRLEVAAIALSNGYLGGRVRVRMVQVAVGGVERIAEGIVRSASLVEVAQ